MSYYFSAVVPLGFDAAVARTMDALKSEGFGVITDVDVREVFKKKLNQDFRPYRILGACNPVLANQALHLEDKIGTMLPCNVVVQDLGGGWSEVAAIDPVASMQAIVNAELAPIASEVRDRLRRVIASLGTHN